MTNKSPVVFSSNMSDFGRRFVIVKIFLDVNFRNFELRIFECFKHCYCIETETKLNQEINNLSINHKLCLGANIVAHTGDT